MKEFVENAVELRFDESFDPQLPPKATNALEI